MAYAAARSQQRSGGDAEMLGACPEFISIGGMFKANPRTEGDKRVVYFEASNEGLDQQGEVVVAKALADSADYFRKYGVIDLDHYSQIGPKLGIPDYASYEIGRPVEVKQDGKSTFVKANIYSGSGKAAEKANMFWSSVTDVSPPQRWFPSVAGSVLEKAVEVANGTRKALIKKVRWSGVGLSKMPVNQHVAVCATVPVGAFAKCWGTAGLDIAKALEAGYGTDAASLSGGAALRKESLYGSPVNYFDFRNRMSSALTSGACGRDPGIVALVDHAVKHFGCSHDEAAEHVEQFMKDIRRGLKNRSMN